MDKLEICKHINDGANFYLRLLGDARHMEYSDNGCYSIICPKTGCDGGTSLFNIRLENLPDAELRDRVNEIKAMNMHTWWGFGLPERILDTIWGSERPQQLPEPNDEEACMALLPENKPIYGDIIKPVSVKKVDNASDFRIWADMCNKIMHEGYPIIHSENHYHLCESGVMPCYIGYYDGTAASACSVMNNGRISSLEFVSTLEEYRRKGLARAVCTAAIDDTFKSGSEIITLRAFGKAKELYKMLGFEIY